MNVSCPGCSASYFVDEAKIPASGGRLTCPSCSRRWEIFRQGTQEMRAVGAGARDEATTSSARRVDHDPPDQSVCCPKCGHEFRPAPKPRPLPRPPSGRRMILLVEDQHYFAELTRDALGPDYRTVSVGTKDEALKIIASEPPNLMILDLSLARNQDGRDLLKALPGKSFPILIFTAKDETELYGETWEELKRLGADDVVLKGMNVGEELRRKVAALLP